MWYLRVGGGGCEGSSVLEVGEGVGVRSGGGVFVLNSDHLAAFLRPN